jgi:SAM-dependent methyltransferase
LLDLGSGTGEYARVLANLGYDVTCFDFSAVAVAKANELGLKAICGDFYSYSFQPAYHIAFARSFSCLNTNQQDEFLRSVGRISPCLLPGGVALYMGYSNLSGAWDSGNWYHLSADDLERFFGKGRYLVLPFARKQLLLPTSLNRLISQWACRTQLFGSQRNAFIFAQLPTARS